MTSLLITGPRMAGTAANQQQQLLHNDSSLPDENDFLLFAEEDNEEETTRKLKSPGEPVSLFFYALSILHPGAVITHRVYSCSYKSYPSACRYLAYGVLRI